MTLDEIKADIVAACKAATARGFQLKPDGFVHRDDSYKACGGCALHAVAYAHVHRVLSNSGEILPIVQRRYGWTIAQAWAFADGFDNWNRDRAEDSELYDLGRAVRSEVLP